MLDFLPAPRNGDSRPHGQGFLLHWTLPQVPLGAYTSSTGITSRQPGGRPAPGTLVASGSVVVASKFDAATEAGQCWLHRMASAPRAAAPPGLKAGASCGGVCVNERA